MENIGTHAAIQAPNTYSNKFRSYWSWNELTLSAEKTKGGTVKGKRLGPPAIIWFFTVHIIWLGNKKQRNGKGEDSE